MQSLPTINWSLARRVARPLSGELPSTTRAEAKSVVASLRLAAQRAGELVVEVGGLPGGPAKRVVVCDRDTWTHGAQKMVAGVLEGVAIDAAPPGGLRSVKAAGYGAVAGIALGRVSRHLLGQFDPASSQLFLVAPNILHMQRVRGFVATDFQLWVAAHEQTHALQFSAAPWLLDHLMSRFETIAADEVGAPEVMRNLARGHDMASATVGAEARQALMELTSVMTLLEGHADFISDKVGAAHIPSVRKLRRAFARTHPATRLARLVPALDKNAQYRDGLRFCRTVAHRRGVQALAPAFDSPLALPDRAEIGDPEKWLRRVHGTS